MSFSTSLQLLLAVVCLATGDPASVTAAVAVVLVVALRGYARRRLAPPAPAFATEPAPA